MPSYGHDKCQTISCPNRATGTLTYTPKGFEECTERVCGVCAEDYVNRPVLRATFTLDGAHETQPEETDEGWQAVCPLRVDVGRDPGGRLRGRGRRPCRHGA